MKHAYLNIRLAPELHDKFRYIARYEGRSMSAHLLWLVQRCVREFEKEHGIITEGDMNDAKEQKGP